MDQLNIENFYKNILPDVSRETCKDLEIYIDLIIEENKVINLISRENENRDFIRKRHIFDSMQITDFIDFNQKNL